MDGIKQIANVLWQAQSGIRQSVNERQRPQRKDLNGNPRRFPVIPGQRCKCKGHEDRFLVKQVKGENQKETIEPIGIINDPGAREDWNCQKFDKRLTVRKAQDDAKTCGEGEKNIQTTWYKVTVGNLGDQTVEQHPQEISRLTAGKACATGHQKGKNGKGQTSNHTPDNLIREQQITNMVNEHGENGNQFKGIIINWFFYDIFQCEHLANLTWTNRQQSFISK